MVWHICFTWLGTCGADELIGHLASFQAPDLVNPLPRSSLPMRESSSDQSGRGEQRCCISSDAEGRILATSFPTISHPLSIRPVPDALYRLGEQFDSENTGTAIARVGRAVSPVPPSQKTENARMYQWLDQPSSPVSSHIAVEGSRMSLEYRVSPGVSEMHPPPQPQLPSLPKVRRPIIHEPVQNSARESREDHPFISSDSSEILFRYEELMARLRRLERDDRPVPNSLSPGQFVEVNAQDADIDGTSSHREQVLAQASSRCTSETPAETNGQVAVEGSEPDAVATNNTEALGLQLAPTGHTSSPPMATHQADAASEGSDPNETWKTFLFGNEDSDEVVQAAFEEAKQDAVRTLQPSDSPLSPEDNPEFDVISNLATVGTRYTRPELDDFVSTNTQSPDALTSTEAATHFPSEEGPLSDEMESEPVLDNSDVAFRAPSIEVNAGTSSVSDDETPIHTTEGSAPEEIESSGPVFEPESPSPVSEEVESGTSESHAGALSTTTSMAVAPPRSDAAPSETATVGEHQFRFAQPKLFVGSRSNLSQPTGSRPGITLTRRRRGRPRKRADDGRADIRALPNYTSDPIEEFEEEGGLARDGRALRGLFPALELS